MTVNSINAYSLRKELGMSTMLSTVVDYLYK